MIIGACGVPRALGETRDYDEIFSQLAAAGIEAYFPTTQYTQIPQPQSLGFETDFLPPPHGTATPAVYEAMRAHGIKLAVNAEHLYDFSQPFPPLHEDPLVALIQAAGADLIYGVYAPDEPAFHHIDPAVSQLLYERVKAIAPSIPVLQVHRAIDEEDPDMQTPEGQAAYLAEVLEHAQWADMVGFDVYPIGLSIGAMTPYSNGQIAAPAQAIRDYMTWLVENVPDKQHLMVLQGFSPTDLYSPEALAQLDPEAVAAARAPTAEEMRDMLAASEGAAAVWWWGQSNVPHPNSQTWQDIVGETRAWVDTNGSAETTVIFGTANNDSLVGGVDSERLVGGLGNDTLQGNGANDVLVGGAGVDTMKGGAGNDTYYVDSVVDKIDETSGSGVDDVRTPLHEYSLANTNVLGAVENLVGTSSVGQFLTGNNAANVITGSWGDDLLNGGAGADTLRGGGGNDAYVVQDVGDVVDETGGSGLDEIHTTLASYSLQNVKIRGTVEDLTGLAATGHTLTGNSLANVITGGLGNDTLDGDAGEDTLRGGVGNDIYIADGLDIVDESTGAGIDEVRTSESYYTLAGAHVHGIVENLRGMAQTAQHLVGNNRANTITSGTGDDVLNGGTGADVLRGGAGGDYYIVDNVGDTVVEAANEGIDAVQSSISLLLGPNVENLLLVASGSINGTGNSAANVIVGTSGNNVLNGGAGNDTLLGGKGSDTYVVDSTGDLVLEESANPGEVDLVYASVACWLGENVENLTLTGASSIYGIGNQLANRMVGNAGNNLLDGGAGIDTMIGAAGNDSYIVDNVADVIVEGAGQGADNVNASVSYVLAPGVSAETLRTTAAWATTAVNLIGNELAQSLQGNAGANVLNGRAGADTMVGLAGNDTYVVDNARDRVVEAAGGGTDTVIASVHYILEAGSQVEILTIGLPPTAPTGNGAAAPAAINLTGNALSQTLQGNAGANELSGGLGNDTLIGLGGNDKFVFNTTLGASNVDRITNFSVVNDAIVLENAIFRTLMTTGTLAAGAFHIGAAAADADDRIYYNASNGALMYDSNGSLAGGSVQFAKLSTGLAMTNADFIVI